jgi:hypothetical protein
VDADRQIQMIRGSVVLEAKGYVEGTWWRNVSEVELVRSSTSSQNTSELQGICQKQQECIGWSEWMEASEAELWIGSSQSRQRCQRQMEVGGTDEADRNVRGGQSGWSSLEVDVRATLLT